MSRQGDCWANSVSESFFGRLKQEHVMWRTYQKRFDSQQDILNYMTMFYNSNRLHSFIAPSTNLILNKKSHFKIGDQVDIYKLA